MGIKELYLFIKDHYFLRLFVHWDTLLILGVDKVRETVYYK